MHWRPNETTTFLKKCYAQLENISFAASVMSQNIIILLVLRTTNTHSNFIEAAVIASRVEMLSVHNVLYLFTFNKMMRIEKLNLTHFSK